MSAPTFEFTDRAVPVVQMGRSERRQLGNDRWGRARWGVGKWGRDDWEPVWTDLTCEIHEITTDTGRGGATDRFVPGTADIVASNVNQISEMIFPPVPDMDIGFRFEYVPQPPIDHEEDLQAPNAATVVSNGWSFSDDFETIPPRWIFPAAWATSGLVPCRPFRIVDEAFEPEMYWDDTVDQYVANGAAQWTANYDPAGDSEISVTLTNLDWSATATGDPEIVVELYLRSNTTNKECNAGQVRFVPVFGGANQVFLNRFHMLADGTPGSGFDPSPTPYTAGTGSNGVFGPRTIRFSTEAVADGLTFTLSVSGVESGLGWVADEALPGTRIGMSVHYVEGAVTGTTGAPRITTVSGEDFTDDLTRPLGSGWTLPAAFASRGDDPMIADGGAMYPTQRFEDMHNGQYAAYGMAQWTSEFDGDQFVELELADMQLPDQQGDTFIEIYTHGHAGNAACMVAEIVYDTSATGDNEIRYSLWQYGPYKEFIDYAPAASGTISLGEINGAFTNDRWRVESDLTGEQRLYRNSILLLTAQAPDQATGGRVGVHMDWRVHDPSFLDGTGPTPAGPRIDRFTGGLREPLGTEELGLWVRIGVDHATLGEHWLFRGFVDAVVPTYVPDRPDAVRIECIDSLGEAGRVQVDGDRLPHRFAGAPTRIRQILNQAHWPTKFRQVHDDATIMSRPGPGKAVDLLTHVAESCGGAVYGDPTTGDIVFKGQDWQGHGAGEPQALITNGNPHNPEGLPEVCPVGWERSARRSDMTTRARFVSETSNTPDGEPIVTEWRSAPSERLYGVELYERTLLCITRERLHELNVRQLRLRHPNQFPRIEAVLLDAATADEALDLMTTATFTRPSNFRCQLWRDGAWVFNRRMLVTGVRHRIQPSQWTCRLALDPATVFAEVGGRWGRARWGRDVWGRTR